MVLHNNMSTGESKNSSNSSFVMKNYESKKTKSEDSKTNSEQEDHFYTCHSHGDSNTFKEYVLNTHVQES